MFNVKSIAIAIALSASALVSTAPAADARDKVIVVQKGHLPQHARPDRHNARDYRAMRRAEARRAEARHDRRHDRRNNGSTVVLKVR